MGSTDYETSQEVSPGAAQTHICIVMVCWPSLSAHNMALKNTNTGFILHLEITVDTETEENTIIFLGKACSSSKMAFK